MPNYMNSGVQTQVLLIEPSQQLESVPSALIITTCKTRKKQGSPAENNGNQITCNTDQIRIKHTLTFKKKNQGGSSFQKYLCNSACHECLKCRYFCLSPETIRVGRLNKIIFNIKHWNVWRVKMLKQEKKWLFPSWWWCLLWWRSGRGT